MGIPRSEEQFIFHNTNRLLGGFESEYVPDQTDEGRLKARLAATAEMEAMAQELARDRIKNPREDLVTMLVNGVEGDNMTPEEMSAFFSLLLLAGNETTRNAIAHGMLALTQFPEQRERWQSDFDEVTPTAVEEVLRWATPVIHMRRTVTADGVRLGDLELSAGDKVVMWYYAANRDPAVFEDPLAFDVLRRPNDHQSFGAPGAHYCLGAHLARREIAVTFRELFRRLPDIEVSGPPQWLTSNFLNGIKHLPVTYRATTARD
jgi:cytochrome P450